MGREEGVTWTLGLAAGFREAANIQATSRLSYQKTDREAAEIGGLGLTPGSRAARKTGDSNAGLARQRLPGAWPVRRWAVGDGTGFGVDSSRSCAAHRARSPRVARAPIPTSRSCAPAPAANRCGGAWRGGSLRRPGWGVGVGEFPYLPSGLPPL